MSLKNRAKSNGRIGYLLSLITVLSLTVLTAKAQADVISTNSNNAEMKRIDDKFHDCTRSNQGNHQGIQNCIDTARKDKQQEAKQRNNNSGVKIANNPLPPFKIGAEQRVYRGGNESSKSKPDLRSQNPKSAPQPKPKTIKSGATVNQPVQQPKPTTKPTQLPSQPTNSIPRLFVESSVDWFEDGEKIKLPFEGNFSATRETGKILKDNVVLKGVGLKRFNSGKATIVWVEGYRFGLFKYVITRVGIKIYGIESKTILEKTVNQTLEIKQLK